ncbi:glycosyl hydrolases family 18-domain-containing protein [Chytriomyces sp. MP71]|nr:glycosyl hydrolases family 18-domain-containing protein [Chytriomyces sp. MP71]
MKRHLVPLKLVGGCGGPARDVAGDLFTLLWVVQGALAATPGKVLVVYLPNWTGVSASQINFSSRQTGVNSDFTVQDPGGLSAFAQQVHASGAKALISIGGWGTAPFSQAFSTSANRATFANSIASYLTANNLDGVDLDWEYPNEQGACGAVYGPTDAANYLLFLQSLRAALGPNKLITAATAIHPFLDAKGSPSADVSQFAKYFDWINIMAYDLNQIWGLNSGPVAPLQTDKFGMAAPNASIVDAVKNWIHSGFPANQIALGTGFYGHYVTTQSDISNNDPSNFSVPVQHGALGHNCAGAGLGGTYPYTQIVQYVNNPSWISKYDPWTQTPWLFNPSTKMLITYDNVQSLSVKASYAACMGLKGMMVWEVTQDGGLLMPSVASFLSKTGGPSDVDCLQYALGNTASTKSTSATFTVMSPTSRSGPTIDSTTSMSTSASKLTASTKASTTLSTTTLKTTTTVKPSVSSTPSPGISNGGICSIFGAWACSNACICNYATSTTGGAVLVWQCTPTTASC